MVVRVMIEFAHRFPDARILVFARAPRLGRVKTRLQQSLGAQATLDVYRQLLWQVWMRALDSGLCPLQLCAADTPQHPFFARLPGQLLPVYAQQGDDLGSRMRDAALMALRECESVLIVGSDCVSLDADYLGQALALLRDDSDVVLGPAEDGGYVLLGLRRADVPIFDDMPWGSSKVLDATRHRLRTAGIGWQELAPRWDVDTLADLRRAGIEAAG
jgi:rSAM/selenodomain-associated transferase 1